MGAGAEPASGHGVTPVAAFLKEKKFLRGIFAVEV
jgi:hypothetical protein